LHVVWLFVSMLPTQVAPFRATRIIAVFNQRRCHFGSAGSEVHSEQGFSTDLLCPCNELICPKLVRLKRVPGTVEYARAILLRTHSIEPVISRNKVYTGIA